MLLPEEIRSHFKRSSIKEESHGTVLRLEEYAELVPPARQGMENTVLDEIQLFKSHNQAAHSIILP
jgi:hypothetical protein